MRPNGESTRRGRRCRSHSVQFVRKGDPMPRPLHWLVAPLAVAGLALGYLAFQSQSRALAADSDAPDVEDPSAAEDAGDDEKAAEAAFEVYKDRSGQYRWRLRMTNKQVI